MFHYWNIPRTSYLTAAIRTLLQKVILNLAQTITQSSQKCNRRFTSRYMICFMGRIKNVLGDNIRLLRVGKGWTQVYLADRLQITAPFLAQIESGKRGTSLELVESVAELFGIPIASLFLEQTTPHTDAKRHIHDIELKIAEKQLQETVAENIAKTFEKLRGK